MFMKTIRLWPFDKLEFRTDLGFWTLVYLGNGDIPFGEIYWLEQKPILTNRFG